MDDARFGYFPVRGGVVHGMAVGHGNVPHRGPPGMGGNGIGFNGKPGQQLEEVIVFDLAPYKGYIVTQCTYFSGKFIHKTDGGGPCMVSILYGNAVVGQDRMVDPFFQDLRQSFFFQGRFVPGKFFRRQGTHD